jgi:hypothetical protein
LNIYSAGIGNFVIQPGAGSIGQLTVTTNPGGGQGVTFTIGTGSTLNQLVTAINAWATANLHAGASPIMSIDTPADGSLIVTGTDTESWTGNGTPGSFTYYIQGTTFAAAWLNTTY